MTRADMINSISNKIEDIMEESDLTLMEINWILDKLKQNIMASGDPLTNEDYEKFIDDLEDDGTDEDQETPPGHEVPGGMYA